MNFLPLSILSHFKNYANCYFLFVFLLMLIPGVSPVSPFSALNPLLFVLIVSEIREFIEEFLRFKRDMRTNNRITCRVSFETNEFSNCKWSELFPGDIVRIRDGEIVPADVCILSCSSSHGLVMVDTCRLDGETNLKKKRVSHGVFRSTFREGLLNRDVLIAEFTGADMYSFKGSLNGSRVGSENVILRGSFVRSTEWVQAVVVFAGKETKTEMNCVVEHRTHKTTRVDKVMNKAVILLFTLQVALSTICTFSGSEAEGVWYMESKTKSVSTGMDKFINYGKNFLTFIILYSSLIPSSVWVACEVLRMCQSISLERDKFAVIKCNSKNLHDDLGQVTHLLTDKTGTLTANKMRFVGCSIGKFRHYSDHVSSKETNIYFKDVGMPCSRLIHDLTVRFEADKDISSLFLNVLGLCHSCDRNRSASPDEAALVTVACKLGFDYILDQPSQRVEILHTIEFSSERRMMTVVVKFKENGRILVLSKGADSSLFGRLSSGGRDWCAATRTASKFFSGRGLRVLCVAYKEITEQEWLTYESNLRKEDFDEVDHVALANRSIESELVLLGCTAVEDELQENVQETLCAIRNAGIKICMITGDRRETAIGISRSCGLITNHDNTYLMVSSPRDFSGGHFVLLKNIDELKLDKDELLAGQIDNSVWSITHSSTSRNRSSDGMVDPITGTFAFDKCECSTDSAGKVESTRVLANTGTSDKFFSLVLDGENLSFIMTCDSSLKKLVNVINHPQCEGAVFCRVSPKQKGELVTMIAKYSSKGKRRILAIGDGSNDVDMLRIANIGVGISGKEGSQAAVAGDYSISKFADLYRLIFIHGRWCWFRTSNFVHLFMHKNFSFTMCLFLFTTQCGFSGQSFFNEWYILNFNAVFALFPLLYASIMDHDQHCERDKYPSSCESLKEISDDRWKTEIVPKVYKSSESFSGKTLLVWFLVGIAQAFVFYSLADWAWNRTGIIASDGKDISLMMWSMLVFTLLISVVSVMTLIYTVEWTLEFFIILVLFNFGIYFGFVFIFDSYWMSGRNAMYALASHTIGNWSFWLIIIVVSFICVFPIVALRQLPLIGVGSYSVPEKLRFLQHEKKNKISKIKDKKEEVILTP